MRQVRQSSVELPIPGRTEAALDLVVPFTTPELTTQALNAAQRMGTGLNAVIRLLKIQVVPFPLDLAQSPVLLEFLRQQLSSLQSKLPVSGQPSCAVSCEVRLARDFEPGLEGVLSEHSLIVLAADKRPWRTRTERLAASLRRAGHTVVLVRGGNNTNA